LRSCLEVKEQTRQTKRFTFPYDCISKSISYYHSGEKGKKRVQRKEKGTGNFLNQKSSQSPFYITFNGGGNN